MNSTLEVLEWPLLQKELSKRAKSTAGQRYCASLDSSGLSDPESMQCQALAVLEIAQLKKDKSLALPLTDIPEATEILKRIARSGKIFLHEFADLVRFHRAVQAMNQFLLRYAATSRELIEVLKGFEILEEWSREHFKLLDSRGDLVDSASDDLRVLRKLGADLRERIEERLDDYLHNPKLAELMQDFYVTVRDGRYVIPIKTNFRGRVPGIIHDVSNTEATLFIEPQEIVDLNNQLKVTEKEIEREIENILMAVVERTQPFVEPMQRNQALLTRADFLAAAADFSLDWNCDASAVEWGEEIAFEKLRHPLLALKQQVVANTFSWRGALVLTGPNTGGKTVLLKSVGLAVSLAQAGLPVPAASCRLPIDLKNMRADIGDDQNLDANLSTFSGHLLVLKEMLEFAESGDLVLIDEIATGTSPEEGQPLAQAVIEKLLDKGVHVFVTTHYGALKNFAMSDERCRIAAMSFDNRAKAPTYEILLDIPGSSSAFEAAEQLELPASVIERARQLRGDGSEDLTKAVKRLEEARLRFLDREQGLETSEQKAREREHKAQQKVLEYEAKQREGLGEHAREILRGFQEMREELSLAVKSASMDDLKAGATKLFTKISDGAEKLRDLRGEANRTEASLSPLSDEEVREDAIVEVENIGIGTLLEVPKNFDARTFVTVQVGELKMRIQRAKLRKPAIDRVQKHMATRSASLAARGRRLNEQSLKSGGSPLSNSSICDVRGRTVEEALRKLEIALNDLMHFDQGNVTVIHGHGSDRLKDSIRNYLEKRDDLLFRPGSWPGEGGDGVTVVERRG